MIPPINPTRILSALDNESSLWPLLVKDLIDNGGRSLMEYKRGGQGAHHAGRERAIEEFTTTAVWIGGRKVLDRILINPVIRRFGLDPKVDIQLLLKNTGQHVPQWIAARRNAYLTANLLRFAVGTLVPVAIIGWVIPSVNQAITRHKLAQEKLAKSAMQPAPQRFAPMPVNTAFNRPQPMFSGNTLNKLAGLINNDFYSNVAIDMGISGGRLAKARNWADFMEIAVRESSIVIFLYFLGDYVKGHLRRFFDKTQGTVSALTYDAIGWLKKRGVSAAAWKADLAFVQGLTEKTGFDAIARQLNPATGRFDKNPVLELARLQSKLPVFSTSENLSLKQFKDILGASFGKPGHKFALDPRMLVDIPGLKKDVGQGIVQPLMKTLVKAKTPAQARRAMDTLLAKTSRYKGIAMVSSYAISTISIALLTPMFQHWLTKKTTGKVDFPGARTV